MCLLQKGKHTFKIIKFISKVRYNNYLRFDESHNEETILDHGDTLVVFGIIRECAHLLNI